MSQEIGPPSRGGYGSSFRMLSWEDSCVQKFLKAAKHLGITDGAKKILVEARGAIPADDDVR